jgi:hypothetical protein
MSKAVEQNEFISGLGKLRNRKIPAVKELRVGGKVRLDPTNPRRGWVTCPIGGPNCEGTRNRQFSVGATGNCMPCSGYLKRLAVAYPEHSSGAIPLPKEFDPGNPTAKRRAFICANANKGYPDCLGKDFGWRGYFKKRNWRGLCKACLRREGGHRKDTEDRTLENGTKVLLSQEDDQEMVPIVYATCQHIRKESICRAHQEVDSYPDSA